MRPITTILRSFALSALVLLVASCQTTTVGSGIAGPGEEDSEEELGAILEGLEVRDGLIVVREPIGRGDSQMAAMSRGEAMLEHNEFKSAARQFATAVRCDAHEPRPFLQLGFALNAEGFMDAAEACYRSAVAIAPDDAESRQLFARQLAARQAFDEAMGQMAASLVLTDDNAALGLAHERMAIWSYYLADDAAAWDHVTVAEQLGRALPPQFLVLLERRTPRPR